ncbi:RHS family protein [Xenorhabdus sp. KJ12.1]|nr:RHS family protein [Xenorhabdus sp. KJ12.1]
MRVIDDSRWGQTRYRYNTNDQILHTLFEGARPHEERFSYDANGNLSQHLPTDARGAMEQLNQRQQAGRVVQQGNIRYRYDDNGRLVEKTEQRDGFRPQIWRYRWDTQNQLTHCETPDGSRWQYKYDPFGRRLQKLRIHDGKLAATNLQLWLAGKPDLEPKADATMGKNYLWSGDQLIEETPIYADGTPAESQHIRWLYEPGSLTPSARFELGKLHYVVSDHQGTPREMLNEAGQLIWAQRLRTWGQTDRSQVIASNDADYHVDCNFRFMGQYEDEESGLYYNRYRYYSPKTGQYISPDPIGLYGGENPYGYVHNPTGWVDPLGLAECPLIERIINDANKVASPDGHITPKQAEILRGNSPVIQRRSAAQNRFVRKEFEKTQKYLMKQWESNTGRKWPTGATPHHIIPLESGGANKWWNLMPTYGKLPNHSLPGIPGPHAAGGVLRTTIQQGRKALPPGTITDLRL